METKNKTLTLIIFFFSCVTITNCKKQIAKSESLITENDKKDVFFYQNSFSKKSNYKDSVNSLEIKFKNYTFKFRFVDDRTYLEYLVNEKVISDWQQVSYNFNYDSSFEKAESDIKILYNSTVDEGFLVLPGYTEEYPVFNVYRFGTNAITYLQNITTDNENCLTNNKHRIQATLKDNNILFELANNTNKIICTLINEKKDSLIKENEFQDIQIFKENRPEDQQKIIIPSGEYFIENNDKMQYIDISLRIKNNSVVYTEVGNMGKVYNQYLLKQSKIDGKILLKYYKTMAGFTGDADKGIQFGII